MRKWNKGPQVLIMEEAVSISHKTNALKKDTSPCFLLPVLSK